MRRLQVPQERLLQVMKFLQLSAAELDQELRTELKRNPSLTMAIPHRTGGHAGREGLMAILREMIEKEDKRSPLDDGALARMLRKHHGVTVARRAICGYRTKMNILKASQRKQC